MLLVNRKDKARKLKQLQAELLTLEDDINAVAGRKALAAQLDDAALSAAAADGAEPSSDSYPAVLAGLPATQMPAELLQMRLNGALEENGDHQPPSPHSGAQPVSRQACLVAGHPCGALCPSCCRHECVCARAMVTHLSNFRSIQMRAFTQQACVA